MIARRYGICRTVYLIGPWAIKVPRLRDAHGSRLWSWTRGVQANLSERDWSGTVGVAPVLWSLFGGVVNVYPRCEPWPEDWGEPQYDKIGAGWLPRDRKTANVGLLHGSAVWLDYDGSWNSCPHEPNVAGLTLEDTE